VRKIIFLALLGCGIALAHVGSPDVYLDGSAGPYSLFITVRPPTVIPGVAEIQIRTSSADVRQLRVTPLPLTGAGAKFAPTPDLMQRSPQDPQFFTGNLWIMKTGSWLVRVDADGSKGKAELSVPVPAVATSIKKMDKPLGVLLLILMLILIAGVVSIVGAGVREAQLEPGAAPDAKRRSRARWIMGATSALVVAIVFLGNAWWTAEANSYSRNIYRPLQVEPLVAGNKLTLRMDAVTGEKRRWDNFLAERKIDDFLPDHGHLMHLYVIRWPAMDRVWHLHPEMTSSGVFVQNLPDMPAGVYRLYGDVVHSTGFPETVVAQIQTNGIQGTPLTGDDVGGSGPPIGLNSGNTTVSELPDGYKMVWDRQNFTNKANRSILFKFHIETPNGALARDLGLYMGMPGHAAFVKTDGTVFAHVHPSGSIAMPALALANPTESMQNMPGMDMSGSSTVAPPTEVSFPFGFPKPGEYRIIVQIKRGGTVETGMFNAMVPE